MDKALHQFDIWQMNANTTNAIKYILVCLAQPFCKVGMDGVGGMGGSPSIMIDWMWPPHSNSHHQDYEPFLGSGIPT